MGDWMNLFKKCPDAQAIILDSVGLESALACRLVCQEWRVTVNYYKMLWAKIKKADIHSAVKAGNVLLTELLIAKAGGEVNIENEDGSTPLHLASENGHVEVANILIQAGGEVNKKDVADRTPLHWASGNGHAEVVKSLIQGGGEVNKKDWNKETPLHWASAEGFVEVVNILIKAGAEVNLQTRIGNTPLHDASVCGHVEVITALLAAGADKTIRDWECRTPHDVADQEDWKDCKKALE